MRNKNKIMNWTSRRSGRLLRFVRFLRGNKPRACKNCFCCVEPDDERCYKCGKANKI